MIGQKKYKVSEEQDIFCREYLIDLDPFRAYPIAYPTVYKKLEIRRRANLLLTKRNIQYRLYELRQERSDRLEMSGDSVLRKIMQVVDRCMQAEPVYDRDGNVTGEWRFREHGALKGLELMAKHFGLLVERIEVTNPILEMLSRKLEAVSSDDLREFILNVKRIKSESIESIDRGRAISAGK